MIQGKNPVVHLMRGGAPDKINLFTDGSYQLIKHDHTNLVDIDYHKLIALCEEGHLLLPADEGDIRVGEYLPTRYHHNIMLPQTQLTGNAEIIDFDSIVPKNSMVYRNLEENTGMKYGEFTTYTPEAFINEYYDKLESLTGKAIKTVTGSGSRGVILVDPARLHLGGKFISEFTDKELELIGGLGEDTQVIVQDLIPGDQSLLKCNVDFVIRNKALMGYKWDITDQDAVFTNWNFGHFYNSPYIRKLMDRVVNYLINRVGITNAIMNFECFSNLVDTTWMVEFNWRYSNSMFEGQALGIDLISSYINCTEFDVPNGYHKFCRYWGCALYSDIKNYQDGI